MSTATRVVCYTLLALIVGATPGRAQGARGTISGVVIGPAGAPQPNVTLILTNAAGIDRRAVSEADGQFVFGGVQPVTSTANSPCVMCFTLADDSFSFAGFSQPTIRKKFTTATTRRFSRSGLL